MTRARTALAPLLAVALGLSASGTARAVPGDLDPTFGLGGRVETSLPGGFANAIVALPDGSVVLGGTADVDGDGILDFTLARYDGTGALVPEFGRAGIVSTPIERADLAVIDALAIDGEGRIVSAGLVNIPFVSGPDTLLKLTRHFGDGALDRDFGTSFDGVRSVALADDVGGIAVGEDRSIAFTATENGGFVVGRLVTGGSQTGVFPAPSSGGDVAATPGGGFVSAGSVGGDFSIERTLADFGLDDAFGSQGVVRTSIGDDDRPVAVLPQPDGKIVAVGTTTSAGEIDVALVRYATDGSLDPDFGTAGVVVTSLGRRIDEATDAVLAPDGTILVAGTTCEPPAECSGFLVRYRGDGSLDPSFGEGGVAVGRTAPVVAIAMPDDGHVVAVTQDAEGFVLSRFTIATCGNGRLEAGEQCDDGNRADGDCCSAACTVESDESPCTADESACTADVCRAGVCTHAVPRAAGCAVASASSLALTGGDGRARLRWTWSGGVATDKASFGAPTVATDLTLCVVGPDPQADRPLVELTAPARGTCAGAPCWRETALGFRYRDRAVADGIAVVKLAARPDGTRIAVRARGLQTPVSLGAPLLVRLVRHDASTCFEAALEPEAGEAFRFQAGR